MGYSAKDYWRQLHEREGLSAVGQSALSDDMNTWIYRSIGRNVRRFVRRHELRPAAGADRMLEIGVGSGYWLPMWEQLGWQVDGCDLTPTAVERLATARPGQSFWVADVGSEEGVLAPSGGLAAESYDLVTALAVLLHVTQDDAFARALKNIAAAVRPGGRLLLMEPVLTRTETERPYHPERSSRARRLRSYRRPLRRLGLDLEAIEPATVLAANPIEPGRRVSLERYTAWWQRVQRTTEKPGSIRWIGPTMYALDALAMRTGETPTAKLVLFRKRS